MTAEVTHTLRIRCPTWDHLENFYERKVRNGNELLARVPFSPLLGASLNIALEMPDGLVVDIGTKVTGVRQAPDGKKSAIRMVLEGLDDDLLSRLRNAVANGRQGGKRHRPLSEAPDSVPRTQTGLPVPIPADVPIDELVPALVLPAVEDVSEEFRDQYRALEGELRTLREKAAHEVLGVKWDAEVADIRPAYFKLIKRYHPDVVARHDSEALSLLASEIFIYINKAYDRLRESAVAAGKAIIAGPALLPHQGWIADFDDIGTVKPRRPLRSDDLSGPSRSPESRSPAYGAPRESAEITVTFGNTIKTSAESKDSESAELALPVQAEALSLESAELFADARITSSGMNPIADSSSRVNHEEQGQERLVEDLDALMREGEKALEQEDYEAARVTFARLLEAQPRNRQARARYHVAYGHTLLHRDKGAEARTQFEVALKHDPDCPRARLAKAVVKSKRERRPSFFSRLLGR